MRAPSEPGRVSPEGLPSRVPARLHQRKNKGLVALPSAYPSRSDVNGPGLGQNPPASAKPSHCPSAGAELARPAQSPPTEQGPRQPQGQPWQAAGRGVPVTCPTGECWGAAGSGRGGPHGAPLQGRCPACHLSSALLALPGGWSLSALLCPQYLPHPQGQPPVLGDTDTPRHAARQGNEPGRNFASICRVGLVRWVHAPEKPLVGPVVLPGGRASDRASSWHTEGANCQEQTKPQVKWGSPAIQGGLLKRGPFQGPTGCAWGS